MIVGAPSPFTEGGVRGGEFEFSKFSPKRGVQIFPIKREGVVKIEGITYFHTNPF